MKLFSRRNASVSLETTVTSIFAIGVTNPNNDNPFASLSDRELEITLMLTRGTRVPEIATNLNISAKTVNTYRYRMFDKLGVQSDVELTHLALRHKLIQTEV
jgi:two-component system invasion response regulator UvrY